MLRKFMRNMLLAASTKFGPLPRVFFMNGINDLAARQWDWVERMGWHNTRVLEKLALVASEVGEACNECRGEKPTKEFGSELADIILRVVDIAHHEGVDLDCEIATKMAINERRGTRGRLK